MSNRNLNDIFSLVMVQLSSKWFLSLQLLNLYESRRVSKLLLHSWTLLNTNVVSTCVLYHLIVKAAQCTRCRLIEFAATIRQQAQIMQLLTDYLQFEQARLMFISPSILWRSLRIKPQPHSLNYQISKNLSRTRSILSQYLSFVFVLDPAKFGPESLDWID